MKILYILSCEIVPAGGVRIVVEHCNRLAARGHEVFLATPNGRDVFSLQVRPDMEVSPEFEKLIGGFGVQVVEPALQLKNINHISYAQMKNKEPYTVVVGTGWGSWEQAEQTVADRHYGFCQMLEHLFFPPGATLSDGRQPYMEMLRVAKTTTLKIITLSRWMKQFWVEIGKNPEDVPIILNGLDTEIFFPDKDPVFMEEKFKKKGKVILISGYEQNEAKNIKDAMTSAMRIYNTLDVQIWGFAPVPPQYRYAKYITNPTQDEIRKMYSCADVLIQTTQFEARGSLFTIEAMACGCPVVVTNCQGIDDLINEYNCLLVPHRDLDAIIAGGIRILTDESLANNLIANGLTYVKENLNWNKIIDRLEKILEQ